METTCQEGCHAERRKMWEEIDHMELVEAWMVEEVCFDDD